MLQSGSFVLLQKKFLPRRRVWGGGRTERSQILASNDRSQMQDLFFGSVEALEWGRIFENFYQTKRRSKYNMASKIVYVYPTYV